MCTPSICLVLSYQDLFFSFITHSLPAPSIYTLQFLHLPIRIRRYCCAGKACELLWLLFSCLRSLSTLLKCCQGMGGLAYSMMQFPRLHCSWYPMQVAWTGTISLSFAGHCKCHSLWRGGKCQGISIACLASCSGYWCFQKMWERPLKRCSDPCTAVF